MKFPSYRGSVKRYAKELSEYGIISVCWGNPMNWRVPLRGWRNKLFLRFSCRDKPKAMMLRVWNELLSEPERYLLREYLKQQGDDDPRIQRFI